MSYTTNVVLAVGAGILAFMCIPMCICYIELRSGNVPRRPQDRLSNLETTLQDMI